MKPVVRLVLTCCLFVGCLTANAQTGNGNSTDRMILRSKLFLPNGNVTDGNIVIFDDDFSNGYDGNDALKMTNPGENFGLRRDGRTLAIEARFTLCALDTIYYDTRGLQNQTYQIKIAPQLMSAVTLLGVLKDKFTGSTTPVSLIDSTFFFFTVTPDPASKVADRFKLYFINPGPSGAALPVSFVSVGTKAAAKGIQDINWKVETEINVKEYQVERSTEAANNFIPIGTVAATGSRNYVFTDRSNAGKTCFYRIKAIDHDGKLNYSKIAKSVDQQVIGEVRMLGNPVPSSHFSFELIGLVSGKYNVSVSSTMGQQMYSGSVTILQDRQLVQLPVGNQLTDGNYILAIRGADGSLIKQQVMIKN